MKNKKLLYAVVSVISVIVVLAVFLIIWFWGDSYGDFNSKTFNTEFDIPDLGSGAAPQGLAVYTAGEFTVKPKNEDGTAGEERKYGADDYFFISAYLPKGPSRVYVIGQKQGYIGYVNFLNAPKVDKDGNASEEATPHTGHVGGVAINRDNLWVSSTKTGDDGKEVGVVYVAQLTKDDIYSSYSVSSSGNSTIYLYHEIIDRAALSQVEGGDNTVKFTAYFNAQGANDFLYYYHSSDSYGANSTPSSSDKLYSGEFARKDDKKFKKHHLTTPDVETRDSYGDLTGKTTGGDKNHAFVYEYTVGATYTSGHDYKTGLYYLTTSDTERGTPVVSDGGYQVPKIQAIYSIPDDVQGFARTSDGKLILSQSYALKNSKLYYYDWNKVRNDATVKSEGKDVKVVDNKKYYSSKDIAGEAFKYEDVWNTLSNGSKGVQYAARNNPYVYFADSSSLERVYDIPCMSEGLCALKDGSEQRVYVLFESGAKKYKTFVRQILTNVYSFVPGKNN